MVNKLFIIFMLLTASESFAGITFNMDSAMIYNDKSEWFYKGYELPIFKNKEEARAWASQTKWVEPLRRMLKHRMIELRIESHKTILGLTQDDIHNAGKMMQLSYDYAEALEIMEDYRKKGIRGNVGAEVYIGEQPL